MKDNTTLDDQFKSLLKHHWLEEAQHTKVDTLLVEALAATRTKEEIGQAVDTYLAIGGFLDQGLVQQADLNLESFTRATGRTLTPEERKKYDEVQRQAIRWTYLGTGMTHRSFLGTLEALAPEWRKKVEAVSPLFC